MHLLALVHKHRAGEDSQKPERRYLDFVVSDQSLSQAFALPELKLDLIGTFGWTENKAEEHRQLDQFSGLLPPDLTTGRISFYVCPLCGDIGCGAITGVIEVTDTRVIWKDFGYETDYEAPELTEYTHVGPFVFDKKAYIQVLEEIRVRV